jgi:hypothetical protein
MEPELLNRWSQVRILLGALNPLKQLQKPKETPKYHHKKAILSGLFSPVPIVGATSFRQQNLFLLSTFAFLAFTSCTLG